MNKLDKYIETIYKDLDSKNENLEDLKLDMKNNLLEAVNELKSEGYTESESIDIVINRMGSSEDLKSEISNIFNVKKFNFKFLALILISFVIVVFIMNLFNFKGIYLPMDLFLVLAPIYIIYEVVYVFKCFKKNLVIDKKYEIIKSIFILYILVLIGKISFPMYSYINFNNGSIPQFILNPFISLKSELLSICKLIIYFIPLGIFLPVVFKQFRNVKNCILFGILIFIINSIFIFVKGILGMNVVNIIFLQSLFIYLLGIAIGYYIYFFIFRKKQTSI